MADKKVSDLPSLNGADVDPADLLYIVDSSAGAAGSKKITVGQYQLAPVSGGTANTVVYLNGSKVESSSSALTFDGTNLGIGTSSPGAKLHVVGNQFRQNDATGSQGYVINTTSSTTTLATLFGGSSFAVQTGASGTNQLLLDSSGNLGLGVTPSAWSIIKAIEIGSFRNSIFSDNGSASVGIASGSYYNAGWKYALTGSTVGYYEVAGNAHRWFSAPSGTAGNAISFTQAMTLGADGNLAVGTTTTTSARLRVDGSNGIFIAGNGANGYNVLQAQNDAATGISVGVSGSTAAGWSQALAHIGTTSNSPLALGTNSTERARITSGGNLLVGKQSEFAQAFRLVVESNSSTTAVPGVFADPRTDATSAITVAFYRNGAKVGSIDTTNAATSYVTSSDRRLKENIAPAADAGLVIDAIEVVQHDWKVGGHTRYGVIAQDLHTVVPEAVSEGDSGADIEKVWGVDYSKLVPMLIKEIQSLRARVAALEAK